MGKGAKDPNVYNPDNSGGAGWPFTGTYNGFNPGRKLQEGKPAGV